MLNKDFKRLFSEQWMCVHSNDPKGSIWRKRFFGCTQSKKSVWSKCWYDLIKSPHMHCWCKNVHFSKEFFLVCNCINNWIWNRERNKPFELQREVKTTKPMLNNTLISRRSLWSIRFSSSFFIFFFSTSSSNTNCYFFSLSLSVWYKPLATFQQMNKQAKNRSYLSRTSE